MNLADAINGTLELIGAFFILKSILRLHEDKVVRGIVWYHPAFYMLWGYFNMYYYPSLGQWFSFAGGVAVVVTNTIWVGQLIYYTYQESSNA